LATDWSPLEVEATTADYFDMLAKEIRGEAYSKTAHRQGLGPRLNNRSDGSIERKHQNISAVLIGLGYPYISGYKPLGNYQRLLAEVVTARVVSDRGLAATVSQAVAQSASVPAVSDILAILEDPPESTPFEYPPAGERSRTAHLPRAPINYLEREANNISLGRAGEELVLSFERARLTRLGLEHLAERVEQVSVSAGDGTGYDIRSFEAHGQDRFIEVKTTAYGKQTPFFVSRNEVAVSQDHRSKFHLYRLFEFRNEPKLYMLNGSLDQVCRLEAVQFAARPA
jgi:hypothetical protein